MVPTGHMNKTVYSPNDMAYAVLAVSPHYVEVERTLGTDKVTSTCKLVKCSHDVYTDPDTARGDIPTGDRVTEDGKTKTVKESPGVSAALGVRPTFDVPAKRTGES